MEVDWIPIEKVLEIIKLSKEHKWHWGSTKGMKGKYLDLRVDMRDGHCVVKDRDGNLIDIEELKTQGCSYLE
jgi:hypothetical protein